MPDQRAGAHLRAMSHETLPSPSKRHHFHTHQSPPEPILSEPASGTAAKNGREKNGRGEPWHINDGTAAQPGNITSPPVSPQSWEKRHGAGKLQEETPLSPPAPRPPLSPYLLLLLLCHQVCIAMHSLFRLVLIPAALLVEPLGLGEPPNRAGACQQATRCKIQLTREAFGENTDYE